MAVGMVNLGASAYSADGKYFSQIDGEGKLKIWDTESSTLFQDFTPNLHLSTPCTSLHWVQFNFQYNGKRKSRPSDAENAGVVPTQYIALGTSQGGVLLYSLAEGAVKSSMGCDNTGHSAPVSCLSWEKDSTLYTCAEDSTIIEWNISRGCKISEWKTGKDPPTVIQVLSKSKRLVSASLSIKLWCLKNKTLLMKYTGHSSLISLLKSVHVKKENSIDSYLLSSSKTDRLINVWNLNYTTGEKNAVAEFLMEDIAYNVCAVTNDADRNVCLTAVTRSGVLHYYKQVLNGKCSKPLKPKLTMQVVADSESSGTAKATLQPISIITSFIYSDDNILIGHGTPLKMTFEKVKPQTTGKIQVLVRQDPRIVIQKSQTVDALVKTKAPLVDENNVEYIRPAGKHFLSLKRKSGKGIEIPMENRIQNLSLVTEKKISSKDSVPKADNMAQLLMQGLHSKDKNILQIVLMKNDDKVISKTLSRLPIQYLIPLLNELAGYMEGRTISTKIATSWLKILIQTHASHLMSVGTETLLETISPFRGIIENRLNLLQPLSKLQGRLDLLITQISLKQDAESSGFSEHRLLEYQESDSSDSESENEMVAASSSDDNLDWEENSNAHVSDNEKMAVDDDESEHSE